jgi:hypothetical protein
LKTGSAANQRLAIDHHPYLANFYSSKPKHHPASPVDRQDPAHPATENDLPYSRIAPPKVNKNQSRRLAERDFLKKIVAAIAPSHPFDTLHQGYPHRFFVPISRKAPRSPCRERSRAGYNQSLVTGWFSRAVHRSEGKINQLDHQHGQGGADLV